ncbi:hypothetical protein GDO81_022845 [Engystomops pustulosus]|uniref:Uncharacterized protein n=1 Tax=Engystomops pustulosus TaxID=76066 RepID=A0AAV6Z3W5_ENGPU|nr:hypothetical protein GDO81_022845 [Engystomops pustulosus]
MSSLCWARYSVRIRGKPGGTLLPPHQHSRLSSPTASGTATLPPATTLAALPQALSTHCLPLPPRMTQPTDLGAPARPILRSSCPPDPPLLPPNIAS